MSLPCDTSSALLDPGIERAEQVMTSEWSPVPRMKNTDLRSCKCQQCCTHGLVKQDVAIGTYRKCQCICLLFVIYPSIHPSICLSVHESVYMFYLLSLNSRVHQAPTNYPLIWRKCRCPEKVTMPLSTSSGLSICNSRSLFWPLRMSWNHGSESGANEAKLLFHANMS